MIGRRGFLLGIGAALAAPAVVRAEGLMKVRGIILPAPRPSFTSVLWDAAGQVIQSSPAVLTPQCDDCGLFAVDVHTEFPIATQTGAMVARWAVLNEDGLPVVQGQPDHPVMLFNGMAVRLNMTVDRHLALATKMAVAKWDRIGVTQGRWNDVRL